MYRNEEEGSIDEYSLEIFWGDQIFYEISFNFNKALSKEDVDGIVDAFLKCATDEDKPFLIKAFTYA